MKSVTEGSGVRAWLSEERQHSNRLTVLSLQLRAAPAPRVSIPEMAGKEAVLSSLPLKSILQKNEAGPLPHTICNSKCIKDLNIRDKICRSIVVNLCNLVLGKI